MSEGGERLGGAASYQWTQRDLSLTHPGDFLVQ